MSDSEASPEPTRPERPARRRAHSTRAAGPPYAGDADPLRGSRTSGVWLAVVGGAVILVLLIIFIAQNTEPATSGSSAGRARRRSRWRC